MNQHDYYAMNAHDRLMYNMQQWHIDVQTYNSPLAAIFGVSDQEIATRKHRYEYAIYRIKKQPFYGA